VARAELTREQAQTAVSRLLLEKAMNDGRPSTTMLRRMQRFAAMR
jgi:hypothetical protein